MGESADALLVVVTMCPTPASTALRTTSSSCAGTAWTKDADETIAHATPSHPKKISYTRH